MRKCSLTVGPAGSTFCYCEFLRQISHEPKKNFNLKCGFDFFPLGLCVHADADPGDNQIKVRRGSA